MIIDQVCGRKNIVRDAFFNRLLFALCIKPVDFLSLAQLGGVDVARLLAQDGYDMQGEEYIKSPLDAATSVLHDPLWVIRASLEALSTAEGIPGLYRFYEVPLRFDDVKGFQGLNIVNDEAEEKPEIDLTGFLAAPNPGRTKGRVGGSTK